MTRSSLISPLGFAAMLLMIPDFFLAQDAALEFESPEPLSVHTFLQPYRSIEISAVEAGVISEILVQEGDSVTKEQPLLKLDTQMLEARLAVGMAQSKNTGRIIAAESRYLLDTKRYEKLKSLKANSSEYELDQALAESQSSGGLYTEALEAQNIAKLQVPQIEAELDRRILKSPVNGVVVEIVKDVAEAVAPAVGQGDEYLLRVVVINQLRAVAHIPAHAARSLSKGDTMELRVDQGKDQPPSEVEGTLEYVSPVIDSASNTIRVRVVVENADRKIRAGSSARLLVPVQKAP